MERDSDHSKTLENKSYQVPIGGKSTRQNAQAQAKAHAESVKKAEAASSSQSTNELTFQEMLGIVHTIIKDWSEDGIVIGPVLNQLKRDICWAICFTRLVQALNNIGLPANQQEEFSVEELIDHIKPDETENFGLANLKPAFKHIAKNGIMKMPVSEHKSQKAEAKGKRVKKKLKLYEDVDASNILERLNKYPVALVLEMDTKFSDCKGVYYLPKKKTITKDSSLHSMLLIGYGVTKEGQLYFIGQNSHGVGWGCKGYAQIFIRERCDIVCVKDTVT